jgi:glycosyltransferase involved in cell wall biosynthesis
MTHKLVSIIIPTFNRAHLVVEAIRSVQAQSYPTKQIIVIDDGSQDDTMQVVAQFEGVKYYRQENRGQAAARNLGLRYAKGEYIASLDSDDVWHREFLTDSVKCLEKHDLDFVFLNWTSADGKESFLDSWERNKEWQKFIVKRDADWFLLDPEQLRRLFLKGCPSPSSSLLLRRSSLVAAWNEDMIAADDWCLILEMVLSKPCCAAFTLSSYWLKRVFGDNVYDGRNALEVTRNSLHDDQLMAQRFSSQLTSAERYILRERLACHYFKFGRLNWKCESFPKNLFLGVAAAFALTPVGASFHITKKFINYIKYHMKTLFPHNRLRK